MTENCLFYRLLDVRREIVSSSPVGLRHETFSSYLAQNWRHPSRLRTAGAVQHLLYSRSTVHLLVSSSGAVTQRSVVHGRDLRFPFMARDDLMVGAVWTAPQERGKGLASYMMSVILESTPCSGAYWYITEERNAASVAVAEKAGFSCVGRGRKVARLGRPELGSYLITERVSE